MDTSAFSAIGHAENFEKYRNINSKKINEWVNIILDSLSRRESRNKIIMDAGAGTGRFSIPIARNVEKLGYKVCSVERSGEMINKLIQKSNDTGISNIVPIQSDIFDFIPSYLISGIFISEVLHLLKDLESICSIFSNNLEKDGWLVIRTPSHKQLGNIEWLKFFPNALEFDISRTKDVNEIISVLENVGFSKIETQIIDESIMLPSEVYLEMLTSKAYSILYHFNESDLKIGYETLQEYCKGRKYCKHTMELTCIKAFKSI